MREWKFIVFNFYSNKYNFLNKSTFYLFLVIFIFVTVFIKYS
jgi:hypothetical protein